MLASCFHPWLSRSWTLRSAPSAPGSPAGRSRSPGGLIKPPFPDRTIRKTSPTVRSACFHWCPGPPGICLYALALKGHIASAWGEKSSACRELRVASLLRDSTDHSQRLEWKNGKQTIKWALLKHWLVLETNYVQCVPCSYNPVMVYSCTLQASGTVVEGLCTHTDYCFFQLSRQLGKSFCILLRQQHKVKH